MFIIDDIVESALKGITHSSDNSSTSDGKCDHCGKPYSDHGSDGGKGSKN